MSVAVDVVAVAVIGKRVDVPVVPAAVVLFAAETASSWPASGVVAAALAVFVAAGVVVAGLEDATTVDATTGVLDSVVDLGVRDTCDDLPAIVSSLTRELPGLT